MPKGSKDFRFSVEAGIFFVLLGVLLAGWLGIEPSNQELLANYAKAQDLANLATIESRF